MLCLILIGCFGIALIELGVDLGVGLGVIGVTTEVAGLGAGLGILTEVIQELIRLLLRVVFVLRVPGGRATLIDERVEVSHGRLLPGGYPLQTPLCGV